MAERKHLPVGVQVAAMTLLAMAVGGLAYYFGIPGVAEGPARLQEREAGLQAKVDNLTRENEILRQYEDKIPDLRRQGDQYSAQLEAMGQIVPTTRNADAFVATLNKYAAASGLRLVEASPRASVPRDVYTEMPYQVRVQGSFTGLMAFRKRVEEDMRIIHVLSFDLAPAAGPADYRSGRLDATLALRTYFARF